MVRISVYGRLLVSGIAAGIVAVLAGCTTGMASYRAPMGIPIQVEGPIRLAFRYPEKTPVRYAFNFRMKSRGLGRSSETSEGIVHIINQGILGDEFTRLRIRRQETRRRRVEVSKRVKSTDNGIRDIFPQLSPNIIRQDPADVRFTFPVDLYGRFGIKEETPFHFLFYDSLCYFVPAMNRKDVSVGESWDTNIPIIIGFRYASNEFTLKALHKLEEIVLLPNGHQAARITFDIAGRFDTAEDPYAVRFSDTFRSGQHIINEVNGSGEALFDIDLGFVVWKTVSFKVLESRSREVVKSLGKKGGRDITSTTWVKDETTYDVKEVWRYISPEERIPVSR